jgi:hypothetical protein
MESLYFLKSILRVPVTRSFLDFSIAFEPFQYLEINGKKTFFCTKNARLLRPVLKKNSVLKLAKLYLS